MAESDDLKVSLARVEEQIIHLSNIVTEQRSLTHQLLTESSNRNDQARESVLESKYDRARMQDQLDGLKYSIKFVQENLEDFKTDFRDAKDESAEKQTEMQAQLNSFNSKVDNNVMFIIKVIALVLTGALAGAGAIATDFKGVLGL